MALDTTANVMTALGISDSSLTTRIDMLRTFAEKAVKDWVKWGIEKVQDQVSYFDGLGYPDIVLRPWTLTITDVWLDGTGYYGDGANAFASSTKLTKGQDYVLVKGDDSRAGLLRRLTNSVFWFPSDLVFHRGGGGLGYRKPAFWPAGYGNVKVKYDYGFATIPDSIKAAVSTAVGIFMNSVKFGFPTQSESLGDYSYSLAVAREPEFGSVRQLLVSYRDVSMMGVA